MKSKHHEIETSMKPRLEKGEIVLGLFSLAVFLAGALRFVRMRHFTWTQAGLCLLAIPAAMLALMIADYTFHHARIVFVLVMAVLVIAAVQNASFCVGLGLGLAGILLMQRSG
jgi:hypothetical protein